MGSEPNKTFLTAEHTAEYKRLIKEAVETEIRTETVRIAIYNELKTIFQSINKKYGI